MGLSAAQKEDWRYATRCKAPCLLTNRLTCVVARHSLDEDKIFERILADNWEAKDRSVNI